MEFMQVPIFAPLHEYDAAGMFTLPHLVALFICVFALVIGLRVSFRYLSENHLIRVTRVIAWVVTLLELVKIGYKFYYGYTEIDSWLPLSFCSLFIYASFMSGYGKGVIKRLGESFIILGGIVGGVSFLLMPTTSLMNYPIWHFLSLHSLIFHVLMIYLNVLYLRYVPELICLKSYGYFSAYFLGATMICLILNKYYEANLMIIQKPLRIPIAFVQDIYRYQPSLYTLLAITSYLLAPALFMMGIKFFFTHRVVTKRQEETTSK